MLQKDIEKLSIQEQVYLSICKFATKQNVTDLIGGYNSLNFSDIKEDFIIIAYIYFCSNCLDKFDSKKAKLTTYLYNYLEWNCAVFVLMAKYQITYSEARVVLDKDEKRKQKARHIYTECNYIEDIVKVNNKDSDSFCHALFEDNSLPSIDSSIMSDCVEEVFRQSLNRYINSYRACCINKTRDKDIIETYILGKALIDESGNIYGRTKITLQELADKYNISKEYTSQVVKGYVRWAQNDPAIRAVLDR